MIFDEDPEVVADLQLRASSRQDHSRTRMSESAIGNWKPPSIVERWKCRTPPCRNFIDVTEEALECWTKCNSWLQSRGEQPIDCSTVLRCDSCRDEVARRRPELLRKRVDDIAEVIRKLKASPQPRQEHDAIRQLTTWSHPDVTGLLEALDPRNVKTRKRGEL